MGVDVLRLGGDLDAGEMIRIKNRLTRLLNKNHKKLLLDLREARRVELAGVGILVDRLMKVRAMKGDIKLINIRPEVERVLKMIGVGALLRAYSSEEEAIQSFAA
jgi:anti-anti-sigma factor